MASQQSPYGKRTPTPPDVLDYRLHCILRTTRGEATGVAEHGRHPALVPAEQELNHVLRACHFSRCGLHRLCLLCGETASLRRMLLVLFGSRSSFLFNHVECPRYLRTYLLKFNFQHYFLWIDHYIHRPNEATKVLSDRRPYSALDTVPHRGLAQGPPDSNAHTRALPQFTIRARAWFRDFSWRQLDIPKYVKRRQDWREVAPPTLVHKLEFSVLAQAMIARNRHRDAILLRTGRSRVACVLCMEDVRKETAAV